MTESINQMIADVIRRESDKYTDIPGDRGGPTKDGISLRYLSGVGLVRGDFNHDGMIDKRDVQMVTPERAAVLYKQDFYYAPHIDMLPDGLQPVVFDTGVNTGPARAVILLQKALCGLSGRALPADGVLGPQTWALAHKLVGDQGIAAVVNAVVGQRLAWYDTCVAENPDDEKFLAGWRNRANSFRMT